MRIRQETRAYFDTIKNDQQYIQKKYPGVTFLRSKDEMVSKEARRTKDDMQREYPSYPKEAFDLAIK